MNFNILKEKDMTLGEVKQSDAIKFIEELGLEGEAQKQALSNYFNKSILALAKTQNAFAIGEEMVLYLEGTNSIVVRKQFEDKIARLTLDLEASTAEVSFTENGVSKNKQFESDAKVLDIVKAFNGAVKTISK